jgi:hypothetical protein
VGRKEKEVRTMTVQEAIDKLLKVENKSVPLIVSFTNITWRGGCETCGYGAEANKDERQSEAKEVYDFETRVVIEGCSEV